MIGGVDGLVPGPVGGFLVGIVGIGFDVSGEIVVGGVAVDVEDG